MHYMTQAEGIVNGCQLSQYDSSACVFTVVVGWDGIVFVCATVGWYCVCVCCSWMVLCL